MDRPGQSGCAEHGREDCDTCFMAVCGGSEFARLDDPIVFGSRWLAALKEIADKTYATQYSALATPAVVVFASEIHHIARAAFDPPNRAAIDQKGLDMSSDSIWPSVPNWAGTWDEVYNGGPREPREDFDMPAETLLRGLLERSDLRRGVLADVEVALADVERLRAENERLRQGTGS